MMASRRVVLAFQLILCAVSGLPGAASADPVKLVAPANWQPNIEGFYQLDAFGHHWDVLNGQKPWSLSAPDPNTIRFEIRDGDVFQWDAKFGVGSTRSEIATYYERIPLETPIHVKYGLTVEAGDPNTANWLVLSQLHFDWIDRTSPRRASPNVSICLDRATDVMTVNVGYTDAAGHDLNGPIWKDTAPIVRGKRYQMELFMYVDPAGAGRLVAMRDGILLTDYHGPIGYVGEKDTYWKVGVYRPHGPKENMAARFDHLDLAWGDKVRIPEDKAIASMVKSEKDGPFLSVSKLEGPFSDGTRRVTVQGETAPGSKVTFMRDGQMAGSTVADSQGVFRYRTPLEKNSKHSFIASLPSGSAFGPPLVVRDADYP